jgi:hypothetical protein
MLAAAVVVAKVLALAQEVLVAELLELLTKLVLQMPLVVQAVEAEAEVAWEQALRVVATAALAL